MDHAVRVDASAFLVAFFACLFAGGVKGPVVGVPRAAAPQGREGPVRALVQHVLEVRDQGADRPVTVGPFHQFSQTVRGSVQAVLHVEPPPLR